MYICNDYILVDIDDLGEEDIFSEDGVNVSEATNFRLERAVVSGKVVAVNRSTGSNYAAGTDFGVDTRVWFPRRKGLDMRVGEKVLHAVKIKDLIALDK